MNPNNLSEQDNELYQKGIAALRKQNYDYAIELFQQVLEIYPDFSVCLHDLWRTSREKRNSLPPSIFQRVIEKIKIGILSLKLIYLLMLGKLESAISVQKTIILLNPNCTPAFYRLATTFLRQGKSTLAKTSWEEILFIDKKNVGALRQLARLYYEEKDYKKATATARLLLSVQAHDLQAETILKDIAALGTIEEGFDNFKPAT